MSEWREVPGFPGYAVSSGGDVRGVRGWVLSPRPDTHGYLRVVMHGKEMRVNRVVALAFHGEPDDGSVCAHLDGNRVNNHAGNLAWVSFAENMSHMVEHGTSRRGVKHRSAKLSDVQVRQIRRRLGYGERVSELASEYGVARCTVSNIKARRIWGWLPD